ncbi:hypothetical protein RIF29_07043 [Crotalaria pallida]|uniref:Uncharacterized protein n=1 Tax=Crotalaria pallida TaxID=3830 RepID=A0AAN9PAM5_CROPI
MNFSSFLFCSYSDLWSLKLAIDFGNHVNIPFGCSKHLVWLFFVVGFFYLDTYILLLSVVPVLLCSLRVMFFPLT